MAVFNDNVIWIISTTENANILGKSTFRAEGQHAEGLPSDDHFLHYDTEAVDISRLGLRLAQRRVPKDFWSRPQQI
jgi:hypothetical protein